MRFKLEIDMDNAAFGETDEEKRQEVAAILVVTAGEVESNEYASRAIGTLRDRNGNTVGSWEIEDES